MSVSLIGRSGSSAANWSSVLGKIGDSSPQAQSGFAAATADVDNIRIICGDDSFAGHGTEMAEGTASGTSRKRTGSVMRRPCGFGGDETDAR